MTDTSQQPTTEATVPVQPSELEQLRKQADEYLKGWQRARADYANLKKETDKEKEEIVRFANAALILEILPLYDHFKRALRHIPEDARQREWVKGFLHIQTQFKTLFTALGLEEIPAAGQPFDPSRHEAVAKEHREGIPPATILEEVSTGFTYQGRVLVPAKVKVSE